MNQSEQTITFEAALSTIINDNLEDYLSQLPSEQSLAKESSLSPSFKRKMKILVRRSKRKNANLIANSHPVIVTRLVFAAILLLFIIASAIIVLESPKVQAAIKAFFLQWNEGDVDIRPISYGEIDVDLEDSIIDYNLAYIPDGFTLAETMVTDNGSTSIYTNDSGLYIAFGYQLADTEWLSSVDTEHHVYQEIVIADVTITTFTSTDPIFPSTWIWVNNGLKFDLTAFCSEEEMSKIYNDIEVLENSENKVEND